ncbi:MAG: hypothetical protein GF311_03640 [Candidatus Lokiarchaeota archaeon]|nr:hypothetical protein [Candidatus Lokiarchaeota archaeon]
MGLLLKGEEYNSNGSYEGSSYYLPYYFEKIIPTLRKMEKGKSKLRIDADDVKLAKD